MSYIVEIPFGTPEYDEALRLRYTILREPLGLDYSAEQITAEFDVTHIAHFDNAGHINGYLQLQVKPDGNTVQMKQVAVAITSQRHGIGAKLVAFAERWSVANNLKTMMLHARDTAIPFYKQLDYHQVGAEFEEVGIKHWRMEKGL